MKNIVICLDGTGNQIEENLSNVLKLYRTLKKDDEQAVFYDQGVGTLGQKYTWGWMRQKLRNGLGLAFGLGLDKNVLAAYRFIVENYREYRIEGQKELLRDDIFIFGFSRGAHTARVLAGMIYEVGLLRPNQVHLSGAALTAYKQSKASSDSDANASDDQDYEGEGVNFRRVAGTRTASVRFLGVWDTVSSVFVPNVKGFLPPIVREKLPHTLKNPAVQTFRHASAVDERRRMFRLDPWKPNQEFKPNVHSQGDPEKQDAQHIWFAGYHSDVGGGYARRDSGISQFPLIWMSEEAVKAGLKVSGRMTRYVTGVKPWSSTTKYLYPEPDATAPIHNSLTIGWWPLEFLPKSKRRREWPKRWSFLGFYLPLGEPRYIPPDANIHKSVFDRINSCPDYKPPNIVS